MLVVFLRQEERWDIVDLLPPGCRSKQQQQWLYVVIIVVVVAVAFARDSKVHSLVVVGGAAKKTATWLRPNLLKPVVVSMCWILDSGSCR